MKKILLGTSALVGVAMFAGQAVAAEDPTVSVGGFIDVNMGAGSGEASGTTGVGAIDTDTEVSVSASGVADNGLEYGAKIELEGDQAGTNVADENYMWVSGSWGKIELGTNDGAHDQLAVSAPTAASGLASNGDWTAYVSGESDDWSGVGRKATDTNDAPKVTYLGSFDAVSFGISFTPHTGTDNSAADSESGGYQSAYEIGVKYSGEVSGMGLTLGAGYVGGDNDNQAAGLKQDLSAWQVGAQISSGGWTVGGSYVDNGDSGTATTKTDEDGNGYALGVSYETGPWTVAADYTAYDADSNDSVDAFGIGATYSVAPGLYVAGEIVSYDDNNAGTKSDGTVAILSTGVSF